MAQERQFKIPGNLGNRTTLDDVRKQNEINLLPRWKEGDCCLTVNFSALFYKIYKRAEFLNSHWVGRSRNVCNSVLHHT